MKIQERVNRPL